MTTANTLTDEAIAYLTEHGFTHSTVGNWYEYASGHARVAVLDAEAACFEVCAFTRDRLRFPAWVARLTCAPLPVFAATVTAAID